MTGLTEQVAGFACNLDLEDVPERVKTVAVHGIVDSLAVTLAGADTEAGRLIVRHVSRGGGGGRARILGHPLRASASQAALANGTMAHALDFDDDEPVLMIGHPSAPIVSALAALAYEVPSTGQQILEAYIAGAEIELALGAVVNPGHYDRGWHATSTLGVLGAAAACARLLALDVTQTKIALGIAASAVSGLKRNFGTMTKPLHCGRASEAAVVAAFLAADGFTADQAILDGPFGLLDILGAETPPTQTATIADLGARWGLMSPGLAIKRFPSCSNTHPALDALLDLRAAGALAAGIRSIVCRVAPGTERIVQFRIPASGLEAKFSMHYCLAVAAVYGMPGIDHFNDDAIADGRVRAVMDAVEMVPDPRLIEPGHGVSTGASITVTDGNGAEHRRTVKSPLGSGERPLTVDQVRDKFLACCEPRLGAEARELFEQLVDLPHQMSFTALADRFYPARDSISVSA